MVKSLLTDAAAPLLTRSRRGRGDGGGVCAAHRWVGIHTVRTDVAGHAAPVSPRPGELARAACTVADRDAGDPGGELLSSGFVRTVSCEDGRSWKRFWTFPWLLLVLDTSFSFPIGFRSALSMSFHGLVLPDGMERKVLYNSSYRCIATYAMEIADLDREVGVRVPLTTVSC